MGISCEPTHISSRKQRPDQSNIILKSKPIVLFKIEGQFFRRPNESASFVGTHSTLALGKVYLLSFAPLLYARVNEMEEDPASPKEERARQIQSSLHSTPQRSQH